MKDCRHPLPQSHMEVINSHCATRDFNKEHGEDMETNTERT